MGTLDNFVYFTLSVTVSNINAEMNTDPGKKFRVIIAGGSVVGLVLANALEKAGVDYLVLEKGDIAPELGATISIHNNTSRVFDQLGILDGFHKTSTPLKLQRHFDEHGRLFDESEMTRRMHEKTKWPILFLERKAYLQVLYDNIRDKSRVRARVGLESFAEDDEGVTVFTSTGEEVRGSILVGADGIHSTVRKLMAESLAKSDPKRADNLREGV